MKKRKIINYVLLLSMLIGLLSPIGVKAEISGPPRVEGVNMTMNLQKVSNSLYRRTLDISNAGTVLATWNDQATSHGNANNSQPWGSWNITVPNTVSADGLSYGNTTFTVSRYYTTGGVMIGWRTWQVWFVISNIRYPDGSTRANITTPNITYNINQGSGTIIDIQFGVMSVNSTAFIYKPVDNYAPLINGYDPTPVKSLTRGYTATVDLPDEFNINEVLSPTLQFNPLQNIETVESGYHYTLLNWIDKTSAANPPAGRYHIESVSGEPLNDGTYITGIGKFEWQQRVTDFDGDKTEFVRDVTIRTDKKPNIAIEYASGDLAGTPYTDGTANGGIDGWSNVPLKASVSTKNADETYLVDGYYFNQLNDELGGVAHGNTQKDEATHVYSTNTNGMWVTGVIVDNTKTTELSETTNKLTIKIDMDNPVAVVSYDAETDTLVNGSYDALSGLQTTKVAIVSANGTAPTTSEYINFNEWRSFVSGSGQYDIYIIATDKAGNEGTTILKNQFLKSSNTTLEISKTVAGKYGSYHKQFEVSVSLKDDQGVAINGDYTVSSSLTNVNDYTVTFTDGEGQVNIKHGETITIKELAVGHSYIVKETDAAVVGSESLYSVTYNGVPSESGVADTLGGSGAQVFIENTRETIPDTGIEEDYNWLATGGTLMLIAFLAITLLYYDRKRIYK